LFESGKEPRTETSNTDSDTGLKLEIRDAFAAELDSAFSATHCEQAAGVDSDRIRAASVNWAYTGLRHGGGHSYGERFGVRGGQQNLGAPWYTLVRLAA